MSDTPETDAKASDIIGFFSCATVPAEFARKLERERDQAREMQSELKRIIAGLCDERLRLVFENRRLSQERDEAREALENHMAATIHTCHDECKRPMCVLRRERDEAREEAARIRSLLA